MKPLAVALAAVLLAGSAALAQSDAKAQPPTAPPPAMSEKNQKFLDAYLKAWEDRMARVDGLETKCVLTENTQDAGRQVKRVYTGDASILKPNHAKLFLKWPTPRPTTSGGSTSWPTARCSGSTTTGPRWPGSSSSPRRGSATTW